MTLRVVDPHMHLWDLGLLRYPGLSNPGESFLGDTSSMAKTYLLNDFLADCEGVTVEQVVHVEAIVAEIDRLRETSWLQSIANETGYPQGIVAAVDLSQPDALEHLAMQSAHPNVRGIRQVLNMHRVSLYAYTTEDWMSDPAWRRNFGALSSHGLSFDLQLYPHQMDQAARLAGENPEVSIILNHAGMCVDRGTVSAWTQWKAGLKLLAEQPNVSVKISGLGMFDHHWTEESIRPYVLETLEAFGTDRSMFASNFPVDRLFSSYAQIWNAFAKICSGLSEGDQAKLFRENAIRTYRLR